MKPLCPSPAPCSLGVRGVEAFPQLAPSGPQMLCAVAPRLWPTSAARWRARRPWSIRTSPMPASGCVSPVLSTNPNGCRSDGIGWHRDQGFRRCPDSRHAGSAGVFHRSASRRTLVRRATLLHPAPVRGGCQWPEDRRPGCCVFSRNPKQHCFANSIAIGTWKRARAERCHPHSAARACAS